MPDSISKTIEYLRFMIIAESVIAAILFLLIAFLLANSGTSFSFFIFIIIFAIVAASYFLSAIFRHLILLKRLYKRQIGMLKLAEKKETIYN